MHPPDAGDLTRSVLASFLLSDEARELLPVLLRELAGGRPVEPARVAAALGWTPERVGAVLRQMPSLELDDGGNVLGAGLTLRPTPHGFEVDGRMLYTWCALDALMFPALLGKAARVGSTCAATGAPIRLLATPDGPREVEPPEAVVSLVSPDGCGDVRSSFCVHSQFYVSEAAARGWLGAHTAGAVLPVAQASQGARVALLSVTRAPVRGEP